MGLSWRCSGFRRIGFTIRSGFYRFLSVRNNQSLLALVARNQNETARGRWQRAALMTFR
jgi:hypothetical protein